MQLNEVLEQWPTWGVKSKPELTKSFTNGLNHITAELVVDGRPLVLKVFQKPGQHEIESQFWANQIGIAPALRYQDNHYRYVLMDLAPGKNPIKGSVSEQQVRAIAKTLNVLHQANDKVPARDGFNIVQFCESYLALAGRRANELHREIGPLLNEFMQDQTPWCFCHNDLVAANIFVAEQSSTFIDWEYADHHNPWFDLAAVIYYLGLNKQQARRLLKDYQRIAPECVERRIFIVSQIALLWGDMLWHLAEFGEGYWSELSAKHRDLQSLVNQVTF